MSADTSFDGGFPEPNIELIEQFLAVVADNENQFRTAETNSVNEDVLREQPMVAMLLEKGIDLELDGLSFGSAHARNGYDISQTRQKLTALEFRRLGTDDDITNELGELELQMFLLVDRGKELYLAARISQLIDRPYEDFVVEDEEIEEVIAIICEADFTYINFYRSDYLETLEFVVGAERFDACAQNTFLSGGLEWRKEFQEETYNHNAEERELRPKVLGIIADVIGLDKVNYDGWGKLVSTLLEYDQRFSAWHNNEIVRTRAKQIAEKMNVTGEKIDDVIWHILMVKYPDILGGDISPDDFS